MKQCMQLSIKNKVFSCHSYFLFPELSLRCPSFTVSTIMAESLTIFVESVIASFTSRGLSPWELASSEVSWLPQPNATANRHTHNIRFIMFLNMQATTLPWSKDEQRGKPISLLSVCE
jgi:hypothetical protein